MEVFKMYFVNVIARSHNQEYHWNAMWDNIKFQAYLTKRTKMGGGGTDTAGQYIILVVSWWWCRYG